MRRYSGSGKRFDRAKHMSALARNCSARDANCNILLPHQQTPDPAPVSHVTLMLRVGSKTPIRLAIKNDRAIRDRFRIFHVGSFLPPMLCRSTAPYRRPSGSVVGND
jgi:hypothetical protein